MFINLHNLPPGQSMFTLFIRPSDEPEVELEWAEEVDLVTSHVAPDNRHLAALVIEQAREELLSNYGPKTVVIGLVNQSIGQIIFDSRLDGQIPLPVVLPIRVTEAFAHPYDALLDLASDEASDPSRGVAEYRSWLLEVTP